MGKYHQFGRIAPTYRTGRLVRTAFRGKCIYLEGVFFRGFLGP